MLNNSHLDVVRRVLTGEMTHAQLISTEQSNSKLNNQHRVAVAVTILLIHAEQCCWNDGKSPWALHRPGLEKTFAALLGSPTRQVALNASSLLGLHKTGSNRTVRLTPPPPLVTIAKGFTPSSPSIVDFMAAARAKTIAEGRAWLPWYRRVRKVTVDDAAARLLATYGERFKDPSFALAVLAQLHGTAPSRAAQVINELPEEVREAIIASLSLQVNPYLTS